MKWVALAICLLAIMPLSGWLRTNPKHRLKLWMIVGFFPFVVDYLHLYMALSSAAEWGGYVKGFEISGLDLVAVILYLSLPSRRGSLAFRLSMTFYFFAALASSFQALAPIMSLFYPWQLARMFLVYAAVAKGADDLEVTWAVLKGMAAALLMEAVLVVWQRFALGSIQTSGTIGHQNLLGLMAHLVILPYFAVLLSRSRGWLPIAVICAGAVIDVSTASRGTIVISALGFAATFLLSSMGNWSPRKGRALLVGAIAVAIVAPAAMITLEKRFDASPWTDLDADGYDERQAYKVAANMMLTEHPFGIGANHFAVIGNVGHYYDRGDVQAYSAARAGNVHNIYYLAAAETGYLGLIGLLAVLLTPLVVALRCGMRHLDTERGNLLLGIGVGLLAVYLHSWIEWSLATFSAEYLLATSIGLVSANARALGYWRTGRQPTRVAGAAAGQMIFQRNVEQPRVTGGQRIA